MNTFRVIGVYGPQDGEYEERTYRARSAENARKRFIHEVRPNVTQIVWERMRENIDVYEVEVKA